MFLVNLKKIKKSMINMRLSPAIKYFNTYF